MLSGTDLNCVDSQGWTPLFHAAHHGNTEAVKLLIRSGADVNHGVETGFTALFSAVMGQHVEVVRAPLDAGARVVPVGGNELRGHALWAEPKKREELIAMLDAPRIQPTKPDSA
jgi:ankyrin repeat protein